MDTAQPDPKPQAQDTLGEFTYMSEPSETRPIEDYEEAAYPEDPAPRGLSLPDLKLPELDPILRPWLFAIGAYVIGMLILSLLMPTAMAAIYFTSL